MATKDVSKLIADLEAIPGIIANLGLGIAEAQKAMNLTYLESIERVAALAKSLLGERAGDPEQVRFILVEVMKALAPTRYQYTKTTMSVKLDLAQSTRVAGQVGAGVSLQAIVVNAAMAMSFGQDYRGAAEVQTVIDAAPAGAEFFQVLVDQAAKSSDKTLTLPSIPSTDQALLTAAERIGDKLSATPATKKVTAAAGG